MKRVKYLLALAGIVIAALFFTNPPVAVENAEVPSPDASQHEAEIVATSTSTTEIQNYEWHRVVKIVDGDTVTISRDGKNVTLRLIGLDTPETVDPRKPVQCFGKEASERMKHLLSGKSVRLEKDASQGDLDKYGRLLAYVYVGEILVNKYMIAEGYGHEYTYNLPYKYRDDFKQAERNAREKKKGLWADGACTNPSAQQSATTPAAATNSGQYECSRNIYNCSSFASQSEAQAAFDSCGGSNSDIHKLDSDGDGEVCESLP